MNRLSRIVTLIIFICLPSVALGSDELPDIGTAAANTLSIEKEIQYGNSYMRILRATSSLTNDPVLSEYITELGNRLVANASQVRTPFDFFLITDNDINAAAFLGGHVKLHTGLFLYSQTESELASVLAHEIAHVTQRHIARSIENSASSQNLTIAGIIGSVLLTVANPIAGLAALQTTLAVNLQTSINYTRKNEYEADRLGMQTLHKAGFQPQAMSDFFGRLAEKYRYTSQQPEIMQTHPLTENRISEARSRAAQYPASYIPPSANYQFAKSRIIARYGTLPPHASLDYFNEQLTKKTFELKAAALYGKALALLEIKSYEKSLAIIESLQQLYPDNLFILDTHSDLALALGQVDAITTELEEVLAHKPDNQVVIMNLAVAYQQAEQPKKAAKLLDSYMRTHPEDQLGWNLLSNIYMKTGQRIQSLICRAEYLALSANYAKAIRELQSADNLSQATLEKARIRARIEQLRSAELAMKEMEK